MDTRLFCHSGKALFIRGLFNPDARFVTFSYGELDTEWFSPITCRLSKARQLVLRHTDGRQPLHGGLPKQKGPSLPCSRLDRHSLRRATEAGNDAGGQPRRKALPRHMNGERRRHAAALDSEGQ